MSNDKLIRKFFIKDCPMCDQNHEIEEHERTVTINVKGDNVAYQEKYYYCPYADEDEHIWVPGKLMNANLLSARNAYRRKHDLLTSDEIVNIRKQYDLSQVELAKLMGWGEATISRYESKSIQDESHNSMLELIRNNPDSVLDLLKKNKDKFTSKRIEEIKDKAKEQMDSHGREYLTRKILDSDYIEFKTPSDSNGYVVLNIDKIEAIVSYFAKKGIKYFHKVKLMKMLWYTDSLSAKLYGHAITGLVYEHKQMGALPIGHKDIVNLKNLNMEEEQSYNDSIIFHFLPSEHLNESSLTREDRSVLDKVISKFKTMKSKEIIEYMHKEKAYTDTQQDQIISFKYAKDLYDF